MFKTSDQISDSEYKQQRIKQIRKRFALYKIGFYGSVIIIFILAMLTIYSMYTNPLINIRVPFLIDEKTNLRKENEKMLAYVKTLIQVPDEKPVFADVLTKEMIDSQPFFENAVIGDKLIIFYDSKKAILYSPKTKMIKELANIKEADPDLPREMIGI